MSHLQQKNRIKTLIKANCQALCSPMSLLAGFHLIKLPDKNSRETLSWMDEAHQSFQIGDFNPKYMMEDTNRQYLSTQI